jgi:nucleotide-binding universal stress UspA family protein
MFKHVLLATDGSEASSHAVDVAVELARASRGRLTTFHATPVFHPTEMHAHAVMREAQQDAQHSREHARHALGPVERRAHAVGVECEAVHSISDRPWQAIIQTAAERGCDVIVMGSHGKHGLRGLLAGSQVDMVLTHCRTPVLVCP